MEANKTIVLLSVAVVLFVWLNAGMGLFYSDGGSPRYVESIHGERVQLFGDGVYANNSTFAAGIKKGTDLVTLFVSAGLLIAALKRDKGPKTKLLHAGLLTSILYYSATLALETVFNRLFLSYAALLSLASFALVFTVVDLYNTVRPADTEGRHTKTAVFTMITGVTALVWLMDIIPTVFTGIPPDFLSIYTTSPTKLIDMGLIFPVCVMGGVMLLQKKTMGYILPPIMLTFLSVIAVTVMGQTALQRSYGVVLPAHQLAGYVGLFVVFGSIAVVVNFRFMQRCWPKTGKKQERTPPEKS